MSHNSSLGSNSSDTAIQESDNIRKKLRKVKRQATLPEPFILVIDEAIRTLKDMDYMKRDIVRLEKEKEKLLKELIENVKIAACEKELWAKTDLELKQLKAVMATKKAIEKLERRFFPRWLLYCKTLSRRMKWELVLRICPTAELLALVKRITSTGLSIRTIADTITKTYADISDGTVHFNTELQDVTREELEIVYEELHLSEDERHSLDCVFNPVDYNDRKPFLSCQKLNGFIIIELNFNKGPDSLNQIRNVFGQKAAGIVKTVLLTDPRERYSNTAFVYYRITSAAARDSVEKILISQVESDEELLKKHSDKLLLVYQHIREWDE